MNIVKIFYDLETTGTNVRKHSVHQIAGIIEVNGEVLEVFDIKSRPHPKAIIEPEALSTCKVGRDEIMSYPNMGIAHQMFKKIICKYIDPYNKKQKAWLVGYNNRYFDDVFLRAWFEQNDDQYIGSLFWNDTIDTLVLASEYLIDRRSDMPSFKQKRVAVELGIDINEDKAHNASYDVELTRKIYRIVTNREIEL